MALVALLFAHHAGSDGGEPRASIEVAGLTLVERQARQAGALGAPRILVVAERMPPGLAAALARLGDAVELVRRPAALADHLADADRVLTFEEGVIVDLEAARAAAAAGGAWIAAKADEPPYPEAERLDAGAFWAGLACYDGRMVREVAANLGEWDLQSTLLRSAAGEGVGTIDVFGGAALAGWRFVGTANADTSRELIAASEPVRTTAAARHLHAPVQRRLLPWLLGRAVGGRSVAIGGVVAGGLAALAFAAGWLWAGLVLALLAPAMTDTGRWLAGARLEAAPDWLGRAFDWGIEPAWYLALAHHLAGTGLGVGAWVLGAATIGCRVAAMRQARALARFDDAPPPRWQPFVAGRETVPWLLLPFGLAGAWGLGLAALAVHAAASFFAEQARLLAGLEKGAGDSA